MTDPLLHVQVSNVLAAIRGLRCDLSNEKAAQIDIAGGLAAVGIPFQREKRLAPGDVIDFLAHDRIGIEVKIKGARSKREVFRQLQRYAAHDQVEALVLVTGLAMGLPGEIDGKPAWYVSLGRAWL